MPRVAGNKGVKRVTHEAYLDKFMRSDFVVPTSQVVTAETSWDQTKGIKQLLMLGNGPDPENPSFYPNGLGDCVPVSVQNGRFFQSLLTDLTFVPGFRRPHTTWVLDERYFPYGAAMGERGVAPAPANKPDEGSDPTTYANWIVARDAEIEFSAEIDVSDAASNPEAVLLRIKQAAVDFDGVALTVNLCPRNMQQFNDHEVFTVGEGNMPNPEDGHGIWLDAFTPTNPQIATWAYADQLVTNEWLTQCVTSCRVYGTRSQAEQAGYDFEAWETEAKTYPGFYGNAPKVSSGTALGFPIEGLGERIQELVERIAKKIPDDFKESIKLIHKVVDAAMEKESIAVVEKLLADFLKAYAKSL